MVSWESLARIDRRILFLLMALAIVVPYLLGVETGITPSQWARDLYDQVEALEPGSAVLVSCDYDPSSEAELYPMTLAVLHHLARKDVRVLVTALWAPAVPLVERALKEAYFPEGEKHGKRYGRDIVNLGYKTGGAILISQLVQSIPQAYPKDTQGTPVTEIPAMAGITNAADIDLFIILSAGAPGTKEWVQQCQAKVGKPMATGCTAVSSPDFFPYVLSKQLVGMLGGLRGAADYEALVGRPGRGIQGMGPQTFGHLLIVLFIVVGNVGYFVARRARRDA